MADTGFFRASSVEITGGQNISGEDNLILENSGEFSATAVQGTDSDPLAVILSFTDFLIPDGNKVTGIEFILSGEVTATSGFVNFLAPTIQAGISGDLFEFTSPPVPADQLLGSQGLIQNTQTSYSPTNHTYTLDNVYGLINDPDANPTAQAGAIANAARVNAIVGNTPDKVVKLTIPTDVLSPGGTGTLQLDGEFFGGVGIDLPSIKIHYERNVFSKIKIQDYLLDHIGTKVKLQKEFTPGGFIHKKIKLI